MLLCGPGGNTRFSATVIVDAILDSLPDKLIGGGH